jgi:hypothetical protein
MTEDGRPVPVKQLCRGQRPEQAAGRILKRRDRRDPLGAGDGVQAAQQRPADRSISSAISTARRASTGSWRSRGPSTAIASPQYQEKKRQSVVRRARRCRVVKFCTRQSLEAAG